MRKPFNLEEALAGKPFEHEDGDKAVEFYIFENTSARQKLAVCFASGNASTYTLEGRLYAADGLLRLFMSEEQNDEDVKESAWHPISTMPKDCPRVLVLTKRGVFDVIRKDGKFYCYSLAGLVVEDATHWMLIPDLPEEYCYDR